MGELELHVDRIGTDVILRCSSEDLAEDLRATFEAIMPMFQAMVKMFEDGGMGGFFGL